MIFILAIILIVLIFVVYIGITWNFDYWFKRGVPCPATRVVLGDLPNEFLRRQHVTSDFNKIYDEFKGYKTAYVGFIRGCFPHLLILDPEIIKDVLIRNFNSFANTEKSYFLDPSEGELHAHSLMGLRGEEWKEKRAEISPAFSSARLKSFHEKSQKILKRFENFIREQEKSLEATELSSKYFAAMFEKSIFGTENSTFSVEKNELQKMAENLSLKTSFINFLKMMLITGLPFMKEKVKIQFSKLEDQQNFTEKIGKALKDYKKDENIFLDFLTQLKNIKKDISEVDLASHSIPFLSHGLEVSEIALSSILYELANNQRVQEKLRDEIHRHCKGNGELSFESLQQMLYLDQVIHEALRLHPPITSITRVCNDTISIEFEGKRLTVEEGINVLIPILQIHQDPDIYMEPEKFHPERFDYTLKSCRDSCLLLPFGGGPRACIGKNLALLLCKSAIAMIVNNFILTVNEKTQNNPFVLDPFEQLNTKIGGLWLNFEAIEK